MIFVDRSKVKIPEILDNEKKRGKKETNKNIGFAVKGEWDKLKYSAYSEPSVKEALIELFKQKCAYCESKFLHVYSGDVEHFRPKGKIEEATPNQTPGYFWLAADWDNLLLSCRNCNQKLSHRIFGNTGKETLGKMNQFPLANNFSHVQSHIDAVNKLVEEEKHRLLINPCKEKPESYFQYTKEGVIKPKSTGGIKFEMAKKSIAVYVLQRMPLVQAREKVSIEIYAQIQRVIEALGNLNNSINNHTLKKRKIVFDKILKRELSKLRKFMNDDEEYVGMARQIIKDFLDKYSI